MRLEKRNVFKEREERENKEEEHTQLKNMRLMMVTKKATKNMNAEETFSPTFNITVVYKSMNAITK